MQDLDKDIFEFIYNNLIILNNISIPTDSSTDEEKQRYQHTKDILTYMINKICNDITIMTNRYKFPNDLKYLVVDLVNNSYELYKSDTGTGTNGTEAIKSMSENGRSVNFGTTDTWKIKYDLLVNNQLSTNEKLINKYKLLYKVRCPLNEQS